MSKRLTKIQIFKLWAGWAFVTAFALWIGIFTFNALKVVL